MQLYKKTAVALFSLVAGYSTTTMAALATSGQISYH